MIAVELKSNQKMIGNVYLGKRDFEALELGYVFHNTNVFLNCNIVSYTTTTPFD